MEAEIVHLPLVARVCSNCLNVCIGVRGVYCIEWREEIQNEHVAEQCNEFEC